jgi:ATP-dependent DNA helicase RecG
MGKHVESERLEFKEGWNPEAILHTICAYANDFHNLGGGYIIVGAKEISGIAMFPPSGLPVNSLDAIQKDLIQLGNSAIQPTYHPIAFPYLVEDRHLLVIWCPGGESRPYKAKQTPTKACKDYIYYIRRNSTTVKAKPEEEQELLGLAASVPFDDRINHHAKLNDLSPRLITDFLYAINSDLASEVAGQPMEALAKQMQIARGPQEHLWPLNVGLLFFNEEPSNFFPQTQIDVVWMPDGSGGSTFTEKTFSGPISQILIESLDYIKRNHLVQAVVKHFDRPEATRHYNYPFIALEEAVVNAVYHRSYELREPIEIRITPDEISILSFPGPDRSISLERLQEGKAVARRYRNRRIGEFLKELDLCEGRATGIPIMIKEMLANGSPRPVFDTDDDRTFFLVTLPVHPQWINPQNPKTSSSSRSLNASNNADVHGSVQVSVQDSVQVSVQDGVDVNIQAREQGKIAEPAKGMGASCESLSKEQHELISFMAKGERSKRELMDFAEIKRPASFSTKLLDPLMIAKIVEMTMPDAPRSPQQKYRLTQMGSEMLAAIMQQQPTEPFA